MSTSNFAQDNTSKIFACSSNNEIEYDCLIDSIKTDITQLKDTIPNRSFISSSKLDVIENRNYPATSIGYYYTNIEVYNIQFEIGLTLKAVSGYYEGFTLDFDISLETNISADIYTTGIEMLEDIIEYSRYEIPYVGLTIANKNNIARKIDNTIKILQQEIETIYELSSTPLTKICTMSNGEALYVKI